jgi:hypothetical protein
MNSQESEEKGGTKMYLRFPTPEIGHIPTNIQLATSQACTRYEHWPIPIYEKWRGWGIMSFIYIIIYSVY